MPSFRVSRVLIGRLCLFTPFLSLRLKWLPKAKRKKAQREAQLENKRKAKEEEQSKRKKNSERPDREKVQCKAQQLQLLSEEKDLLEAALSLTNKCPEIRSTMDFIICYGCAVAKLHARLSRHPEDDTFSFSTDAERYRNNIQDLSAFVPTLKQG
jgi:hypothetical protein